MSDDVAESRQSLDGVRASGDDIASEDAAEMRSEGADSSSVSQAVPSHDSFGSQQQLGASALGASLLPPLPNSTKQMAPTDVGLMGSPYGDDYALVRGDTMLDAMQSPLLEDGDGDLRSSGVSLAGGDTAGAPPSQLAQGGPETVDSTLLNQDAEEEEDMAILDSSHPLMKPIQDAIFKQLSKHMQKLELEIREKEEACRKEVKHREEVGVELYTLQQQLARLQAMLEGAEDNFGIIRGLREEGERTLKHTLAEYKREQEKLHQHSKNLEQHKLELEKISRTLKQVDLYNEELRSRILVAKRTTLKAEEDIIKQEMDKKRQDFFIDHLTEQLRRLQERRAMYETQLLAQQRETKAAIETLQDAATEMEAIQFEKRQLLNQWKSSLIGLQRRDDVLLQIEKGIEKNNEALASMSREIAGCKRALRVEQNKGETLSMMLGKLENEIDYVKRQIGTINDQQDKLKETYTMYMKSLNQAERELTQLQQERQAVQLEINAVQKACSQNAQATQKLERDIAERLQSQLSLEKGAQSTRRDNNRLRNAIHEKESNIASIQNELSNIRLEALNIGGRIKSMKDQISRIDEEMEERNTLIEKYEQEIRRRNDELGKRASEMDILNKKYDQVTGGNEEEHMGPLEATIHNLQKLVQTKEQECVQLQQFWLRAQNELVVMTKRSVEITDETQNLKMRLTVLNRKKMVVNNAFETEEKEIREHNRNIRQLQNDMVKINTLLSKQSNIHSQLEETNLELEQEFRARLKQAELESIQMERQLDDLKSEKARALTGLIEAERQMMLWEKKIQLAKETQAALDPNIGATEIREMGLEIHRMKLRYASMLKLQEKMISEMEKSVYRRESISNRGKAKGKGSVQLSLQKAISELSKKIRQTILDVQDCDQDIQTLDRSQVTIEKQIQEAQDSCRMLEEREETLHEEIESQAAVKTIVSAFGLAAAEAQSQGPATDGLDKVSNETLLQQRHYRRYQDLRDNKYVYVARDADSRSLEGTKALDRLERVQAMVHALRENAAPAGKHLISRLSDFLDAHIRLFQ
ncbi:Coiled-coil domain-containing protein 40 [Polyrhizophydium stewartii]|uniref:Coiled-coil domain-containing protein 40 n=1 Tax=Polyrhizophydium stewartii TaxID=2732419 RepID=A0ABR4N064_9FUNG